MADTLISPGGPGVREVPPALLSTPDRAAVLFHMAVVELHELNGGDFLDGGMAVCLDEGKAAAWMVDDQQGEVIGVVARPNAPDGEPVLKLVDRGSVDVPADGIGKLVEDQTEDDGPGMADLWQRAPRALELASLMVDRSRQAGGFQKLLAVLGMARPKFS